MSVVTHRERIAKTLRGEPTDRIPRGEFFISEGFVQAFLANEHAEDRPVPQGLPPAARVVHALDLDIASVSFSEGWGAIKQPDPDRALESLMQWRAGSDRFLFAVIDGPFSHAIQARGFNELLHAVRGAPHVARDLFQRGAEETRVVAQAARDAGAEGVVLGEDIAYGRSTYIRPSELRDLYFPALHAAAHEIRALGLAVVFHSEGNLNEILPDLRDCELDGLQGLEPESGMQLGEVRARVGSALTLWGNLGFDFLSASHSEEEIRAAVAQRITAMTGAGERSRFIFGACGGLVQGLCVETVKRIYAALDSI